MADMWEVVSKNFVKWFLGVIAGLLVAAMYGGFKFYTEWKADEAVEEAIGKADKSLMFDSPEQKEEHKDHVKEAVPTVDLKVKMKLDEQFQKDVLDYMKKQDCLMVRMNDQVYQIKQEIHNQPQ